MLWRLSDVLNAKLGLETLRPNRNVVNNEWTTFLDSLEKTAYWRNAKQDLTPPSCNTQLVQSGQNCYMYAVINAFARVKRLQKFFKTHPGPLCEFIMHNDADTCPVPPQNFPVRFGLDGHWAYPVVCAILMILQKDREFKHIKFYRVDVLDQRAESPQKLLNSTKCLLQPKFYQRSTGYFVKFKNRETFLEELFQIYTDACFHVELHTPLDCKSGLYFLRRLLLDNTNIQIICATVFKDSKSQLGHVVSLVKCEEEVHLITNWEDTVPIQGNMAGERLHWLTQVQWFKLICSIVVWTSASAQARQVARTKQLLARLEYLKNLRNSKKNRGYVSSLRF